VGTWPWPLGAWPWPFVGNVAVLLAISCTVAAIVTWVAVRKFNVSVDPTGSRKLYPLIATATFVVLLAVTLPTGIGLIPAPIPNAPACGGGCYRADWSKGIDAWGAAREWHVANGLLINDGSNHDSKNGNCTTSPTLVLPYQPATPAYSVEVQAQFPHIGPDFSKLGKTFPDLDGNNRCFGIYASLGTANAYQVQVGTGTMFIGTATGGLLAIGGDFSPGSSWHTYRFDVTGSGLSLYLDGLLTGRTYDPIVLTRPGQIGLADYFDVLYIGSIVVRAL
jgi:hypothetical protein